MSEDPILDHVPMVMKPTRISSAEKWVGAGNEAPTPSSSSSVRLPTSTLTPCSAPPSLPCDECPVCFTDFPSPSRASSPSDVCVVKLSCGHRLCEDCFDGTRAMTFPWTFLRCPLCRRDSSVYTASTPTSPTRKHPQTKPNLFGNVYVQFGKPGLASFHFDSPDRCYVSYANAPHSWKLSDGSPAPMEKLFLDSSFDAETRTFKGKVVWAPLKFGGAEMFSYELVFDPSFTRVETGVVKAFKDATSEVPDDVKPFVTEYWGRGAGLSYLRWNPAPVASPFGSVFCQGQEFVPAVGVASYHFDSPTDAYVSYARSLPSWKLSDGSPPPKKAMFQDATYDPSTRTFTGRVSFAPATFGGSQVRVYRLVFGEDFNAIVDGEVSKYGTEAEYEAGVAPSQGSISFHPVHGPLKYHRLRLDCL